MTTENQVIYSRENFISAFGSYANSLMENLTHDQLDLLSRICEALDVSAEQANEILKAANYTDRKAVGDLIRAVIKGEDERKGKSHDSRTDQSRTT